jgi:hypothetical protein
MNEMRVFCIDGSKKIIFRQEGNVYICFDPKDLEFYEVNITGACILFLVSYNTKFENMVHILMDWFNMEKEGVEQYIIDFFDSFPMKSLIMTNLIELGVPNNVTIE